MKKNLKFVSAAAAALLAVAPVAASTVNANAAVTVNGATSSTTDTTQKADGTVTVNISLNASAGTKVADALKTVKVTVNGANLSSTIDASKIQIVKADGTSAGETFQANTDYKVIVQGIQVSGLTTGKKYAVAGGYFEGKQSTDLYSAKDLVSNTLNFNSDAFKVYDSTKTGTVSFMTKSTSTIVSSGSIDYNKAQNVSDLVNAIKNAYEPTVTDGNATASWDDTALTKAVTDSLTKAGVTVNNGKITKAPVSSFKVTVPATATNGKVGNLTVTVNVKGDDKTASTGVPVISKTGTTLTKLTHVNGDAYKLSLAQNATTTANDIAKEFTAKYSVSNGNSYGTPVTVKSTNLNTAVVGNYTVVLEATNPATSQTADVTINVTVGDPSSIKTVQAGSETAKVYQIDGNNVTETTTTLANDTKVATYGTVTVNGVSYTRLNNATSDQYVLTKYVNGSIKPVEKVSTKRVYNKKLTKVYNAKGEAQNGGKVIAWKIGSGHNVESKTVEINGSTYYKVADGAFKGMYVNVKNFSDSRVSVSTKKTLKIRSRVYNVHGKVVKSHGKTVYYAKGRSFKTLGKKTIKGRAYYKIATNRYILVANFR